MEQELWRALGICPGEVIAFTGGAAKSAVARRVVREMAAADRAAVLISTSAFLPGAEMDLVLLDRDAAPPALPQPTLLVPVADIPGVDSLGLTGAAPAGVRIVPLLSGGGRGEGMAAAARSLLGRLEIGRVVELTAHPDGPVRAIHREVACIVLAGGASRRFGGSKLLHRWRETTIIEAALQAALRSGLGEVRVVTGAYERELATLLERYPARLVPNPEWAEGMSTSLKAGLRALEFDPPRGVLIFLGDQPLLPRHVPVELANRFLVAGEPIVAPAVGGERRSPVLFDWSLVPELLQLTGDEGGRQVVRRYAGRMELVEYTEEAWFRDIDTRGDLPEGEA